MSKSRRWLYGVMAAGLIGLGVGGGTFATFNAATTNPGNTFATGSLYLSNIANGGTACFSYNGTDNNNPNCNTVVTETQQYPGAPIMTGTVKVANVGTINATTLDLYTAGCTDSDITITTDSDVTVTSGQTTVTIPGNWVSLGVGANMTLTDTANDLPSSGNSVVSISGSTLTMAENANTFGGGPNTTDTLQFVSQTSTTGNPLCGAVVAFVEETAQTNASGTPTSYTYCWYGYSTDTNMTCDQTAGDLNTNNSSTLATLAGDYTSGSPLALPLLSGNGTIAGGSPAELSAGTSRTFTIGLYLPDTSGDQNNLMDLQSNFSLTWKIAQ